MNATILTIDAQTRCFLMFRVNIINQSAGPRGRDGTIKPLFWPIINELLVANRKCKADLSSVW